MKLFDIFNKEKRQKAREQELTSQARQRIGVQDFEDELYIAYDGTPIFPIDKDWTPEQIIKRLQTFRSNYVKGRKSESSSRGTAVF